MVAPPTHCRSVSSWTHFWTRVEQRLWHKDVYNNLKHESRLVGTDNCFKRWRAGRGMRGTCAPNHSYWSIRITDQPWSSNSGLRGLGVGTPVSELQVQIQYLYGILYVYLWIHDGMRHQQNPKLFCPVNREVLPEVHHEAALSLISRTLASIHDLLVIRVMGAALIILPKPNLSHPALPSNFTRTRGRV